MRARIVFLLSILCMIDFAHAFTKESCDIACAEGHGKGESSCTGQCNQRFRDSSVENVKCHDACNKGKARCLASCEGQWSVLNLEHP